MVQIQDWELSKKIVVVDEIHHGTVQVEVPKPGPYKDEYYQYADCAIFCLWVDEKFRKQGTARILMETSEVEAKQLGCRSVQLECDHKASKPFVLAWYKHIGYRVMARSENSRLLTAKEL